MDLDAILTIVSLCLTFFSLGVAYGKDHKK